MEAIRKNAIVEVPANNNSTAIPPKKPVASVPAKTPADFPSTPISINNAPLRRGVIPLEWLDLKALTEYVSVSRRTLTEWLYREENPLPAFRIDGKVYIRRSDFDRWMEAHPVEGLVNLGKIVDDVMADMQENE
jgi:excisionase family DNA binding protein